MIRARFKANEGDYRPVNWPIKHPYWCSGFEDGFSIIVAYADDEAEILENWPEAEEVDVMDEDAEYVFTDRFPRPDWFSPSTQ